MPSDTALVIVACVGVGGTLTASAVAQLGEGRRTKKRVAVEEKRRQEDRADAIARERRERNYADHAQILVFVVEVRSIASVVSRDCSTMCSLPESSWESRHVYSIDNMAKYLDTNYAPLTAPLVRSATSELEQSVRSLFQSCSMVPYEAWRLEPAQRKSLEYWEAIKARADSAVEKSWEIQQAVRSEIEPK